MHVELRTWPCEVSTEIRARVEADVPNAICAVSTVEGPRQFIVNSSSALWYAHSGGKLRSRVVNGAQYLSKKFEDELHQVCGWTRQKRFEGVNLGVPPVEPAGAENGDDAANDEEAQQRIDAYIELESPICYTTTKPELFAFTNAYCAEHPEEEWDRIITRFYQLYVKRECFGVSYLPGPLARSFSPIPRSKPLRVGLSWGTLPCSACEEKGFPLGHGAPALRGGPAEVLGADCGYGLAGPARVVKDRGPEMGDPFPVCRSR
jgi:hypothetical protein